MDGKILQHYKIAESTNKIGHLSLIKLLTCISHIKTIKTSRKLLRKLLLVEGKFRKILRVLTFADLPKTAKSM